MKGTAFEGGFRVPAIAWWPGHIPAGSVNTDIFSHMDWWPTVARLAGSEPPPPHEWQDDEGEPIIFDGIDLSDSLLGTGPGKRDHFFYFSDQVFGGLRVKNFKLMFTSKDTWMGPDVFQNFPLIYNLRWDPGEQYDMAFNGAAPTPDHLKTSPGRYSGQDGGWMAVYMNPLLLQFFEELKTDPNIPYQAVRAEPRHADPARAQVRLATVFADPDP